MKHSAAALAGRASAQPAHTGGAVAGCATSPPDVLDIEGRLWDVHAIILATLAMTHEIENELPEGDVTEPVRRLCRVAAEMVESIAMDLIKA